MARKTFLELASEWYTENTKTSKNKKHRDNLAMWLREYILPVLGEKDYNKYCPNEYIKIIESLESTPETAKRVRGVCAQSYMYGVKYDPNCANISREVRSIEINCTKPRAYYAATADIDIIRDIYKKAKESIKSQRNMCALQLLMLTCARPKNVRFAKWEEFRLDRNTWLTPSKRTDKQADHVIPLSRQAVELLDRIRGLNLEPQDSPYLFPAGVKNIIPDTGFASAMKMLGYTSDTQTAFGMRYSAEEIMKHEYEYGAKDGKELHILIQTFMDAVDAEGKPQYPPEIFMKQRGDLAQWWADKLEGII